MWHCLFSSSFWNSPICGCMTPFQICCWHTQSTKSILALGKVVRSCPFSTPLFPGPYNTKLSLKVSWHDQRYQVIFQLTRPECSWCMEETSQRTEPAPCTPTWERTDFCGSSPITFPIIAFSIVVAHSSSFCLYCTHTAKGSLLHSSHWDRGIFSFAPLPKCTFGGFVLSALLKTSECTQRQRRLERKENNGGPFYLAMHLSWSGWALCCPWPMNCLFHLTDRKTSGWRGAYRKLYSRVSTWAEENESSQRQHALKGGQALGQSSWVGRRGLKMGD